MAHFVVKKQSGHLDVVFLSPKFIKEQKEKGLTDEIIIANHIQELKKIGQISDKDEVVGKSEVELPKTRDFRGAWRWITEEPKVDICPYAACEETKNRLRLEREPALAKLDVAFQRAIEENDVTKQSEIVKKKKELRDITLQIPTPTSLVADESFLNKLLSIKVPS